MASVDAVVWLSLVGHHTKCRGVVQAAELTAESPGHLCYMEVAWPGWSHGSHVKAAHTDGKKI